MRSLLCLVSCSFSLRYPPPVLGAGDCGLQTPHAPRQTLAHMKPLRLATLVTGLSEVNCWMYTL